MEYTQVTRYVLAAIVAMFLLFLTWNYCKERKNPERATEMRKVAALEIFYLVLTIFVLIGRFDIYFTVI